MFWALNMWVNHVEGGEMNGARVMYGEEWKCVQGLVWKLNLGDHLEDLGIDEFIILKWILKK